MYIHNQGHVTKMATTIPIYGKTPSKTFFSGTVDQFQRNLALKIDVKSTTICINDDLDLILRHGQLWLTAFE